MSDTEKAWQAWARKEFFIPADVPVYMDAIARMCHGAFDAGHAAASADTARLVRAAAEATINAAAEQVDYDYAIDIDSIVARVLSKEHPR